MNIAHLHIILCHIPSVGAGFTILLILFALIQKNKDLKRTSLWFSVITGISTIAAYLSGIYSEDTAKMIPGITEEIIKPHATWALYFFISLLLIGIIAYAGLFLSRASSSALHKFTVIVLILNILSMFLAYKTGISGGKIRHTEIQSSQIIDKNK
jgi:hypothetical membrane protein